MKKIFNIIRNDRKLLLVYVCFFILLATAVFFEFRKKESPLTVDEWKLKLEEEIPEGLVLYPINLKNQSAFQGLLEDWQTVELWISSSERAMRPKKISSVKLREFPAGSGQYFALLDEQQVKMIERFVDADFQAVFTSKKIRNLKKYKRATEKSELVYTSEI